MSQYQDTISIRSAPADVFRFLSSVSNIPSYAPVIREVRLEAGGRLVALAEPAKQQREINGYFRVSNETRSIEWGTDGTPDYHGRLEVRDPGNRETELAVDLSIERQDEQRVRQMLRQVLESIKRQLEQGGGNVAGGGI